MKFKKIVKENVDGRDRVQLTATIKVIADSIEDALDKMDVELLNADAAITDGNGEPNPEIVDKYEYWNEENEGDVQFSVYKGRNSLVEVENVR